MKILRIILAILLPPLAAYLQAGITKHFWINIILTLLLGIPASLSVLKMTFSTPSRATPTTRVAVKAMKSASASEAIKRRILLSFNVATLFSLQYVHKISKPAW